LLPPHLKTISVQPVENQTIKPGLDVSMTNLLVQDFERDGSLRITDLSRADVVLRCRVTNYEKSPQTYSGNQEVTTWRIGLEAKVDCLVGKRVLNR
jgi:hypothetical protein